MCVCAYGTFSSREHAGCVTARGSGYISIPLRLTSLGVGGLSVKTTVCVCVCVCLSVCEGGRERERLK